MEDLKKLSQKVEELFNQLDEIKEKQDEILKFIKEFQRQTFDNFKIIASDIRK